MEKKFVVKINFEKIIWFLLFIFLFEPTLFVKIPKFNSIYIIGIVITFLYCCFKYLNKNRKISKLLIITFLLRVVLFIPTFAYGGDIIKWGYQSLNYLSAIMMISLGFEKNQDETLKNMQIVFFVYLLINLILYIKYPFGIFPEFWGLHFLGIRTRFTDYLFVLIAISILRFKNDKKFNLLCIILSVVTMFSAWISTAISGIVIAIILMFYLNKVKLKRNPNVLVMIALIIVILVTFFRIQNIFSSLIENLLHKSVSLTGRTEIWDLSYKYLKEKLLLGHGYRNDGNFVYWCGDYWQAHNQFLQSIYDGGIIYLGLFISLLFSAVKNCNLKFKEGIVMISFLFGFIIMMISEIYAYYPSFYTFLAIMYYFKYKTNDDKI